MQLNVQGVPEKNIFEVKLYTFVSRKFLINRLPRTLMVHFCIKCFVLQFRIEWQDINEALLTPSVDDGSVC